MTQAPRRTQEERSAATIVKLLDATIESLIEVGYEQTTSRSVAERAGVSRGAMSHHFPRRADLMVSAVERIGQLRRAATVEELEATPLDPGRLRAMIDALWMHCTSPLFVAWMKLWVAAQEDPDLYARLVPIERDLSRSLMSDLERLWDVSGDPGFARRYRFTLSAVRGLAVMQAFGPGTSPGREDPWPFYRAVLERVLAPEA